MLQKLNATAFLKICAGITIVICSVSLLFFSVSYNTARAGEPGFKKPTVEGYEPVGIQVSARGYVTVYGYNGSEYKKIKILASADPSGY